ncbi:MAG: DUF1460 domain-containing protein [Marinilabiliales bacterium]|nr:MAG: DUF1460 domain-containing protein [Marinilabiliales bacterium]
MNRNMIIMALILLVSCQERRHPEHQDDLIVGAMNVTATEGDTLFYDKVMKQLLEEAGPDWDIGRRMVLAGKMFLGTPYVASTLEVEGDEHLVINLLGVDCTTLVEYVTAMALCSAGDRQGSAGDRQGSAGEQQGSAGDQQNSVGDRQGPAGDRHGFGCFARQLAELRYRGGMIDGYPSRLHYFTEWLKDNERKGYIDIISDEAGNRKLDTKVGFMTANPGSYRQLEEDASLVYVMAGIEKWISAYDMRYISRDQIDDIAPLINDGDIIAFVSDIEGLDVSHTGLAIFVDERLHFLHASSRSQEVEITTVPLSEYLADSSRIPGILVARVKPVAD